LYATGRADGILDENEPVGQNFIRIKISNSTYGRNDKATFSKHILQSIFDFNRYHSSKRNQFKVTKGALGDALKETLCIPYVLAHDAGGEGLVAAESWNQPLKIYAGRKMFQIHLIVDQIIHVNIIAPRW
jgi:hypothetical protein